MAEQKNVLHDQAFDGDSKKTSEHKSENEYRYRFMMRAEDSTKHKIRVEEGTNSKPNRIRQQKRDSFFLSQQAEKSVNMQERLESTGDMFRSSAQANENNSNDLPLTQDRRADYQISAPESDVETAFLPDSTCSTRREAEENESRLDEKTESKPVDESKKITEHSSRMENIRGHPSARGSYSKAVTEVNHSRKKQQVLAYSKKEKQREKKREADGSKKVSDCGTDSEETLDSSDKGQKSKVKQEQKKKEFRLSFADEDTGCMVRGVGIGSTKKAASMATVSVATYVHGKGHEVEQENTAVQGAHKAELAGEKALRYVCRTTNHRMQRRQTQRKEKYAKCTSNTLQFEAAQDTRKTNSKHTSETGLGKKNLVQRFWQKQQYKKAYMAAQNGARTTVEITRASQTFLKKTKRVAATFLKRSRGVFGVAVAIMLLFILVSSGLSSCGAMIQGSMSTFMATTYASADEDIYAVEAAYSRLETALNNQINSMESRHPGYDEYLYQVDEISHNPYHLISYFTALYGEFTYAQVAVEIEEIFRQQYGLTIDETRETITEIRIVRVGESLGQVVTSGYCNCSICCGIWSGGATASGVYPTANHTIAVDASNPFVPMGTKVIMNGVEYVVEDTGAFDRYGVQFDVFYGDHASASSHGHQSWEAYIADSNGSQEVEVTSTREVNRLDVALTNRSLDGVLRSRMDEYQRKRYELYNTTYGNRDYLFDVNSLPSFGDGGFGYEIPAEALTDEKFARMIQEAEKYLGYPYVWGGSSPSTSFDCSGFVSWVINNCGNGWNVGRQTAEGLRSYCAYVEPAQAKPGDLIFFQGTYQTTGASHIGIYVGDNMMIHCGNPIQYANISSAYWQQHFMAFGRIQ